jgi:hypothetical protein
MIQTKSELALLPIPGTYNHTYIYNSNVLGEIRFWCKSTSSFPVINPFGVPDYRVKIDVDGKLKVYYTYDPLINLTFGNGWIDVATSFAALNASEANLGIAIGSVELSLGLRLTKLEIYVKELTAAMGGLMANTPYDSMISQIGVQMGDQQIATVSWNTFRNSILQTFTTGRISSLNAALTVVSTRIATNPVILGFLGVGGIAFAGAVAAAQNFAFIDSVSVIISSNIKAQFAANNITSTRRDELLSSNFELVVDNYIEYCSNMSNMTIGQGFINYNIQTQQHIPSLNTNQLTLNYSNINNIFVASNVLSNLNINQGFINSNIQTQQYIKDLKCDTLNLNTGNIANINGINANEIIAQGKIKQNNILLDETYLTSNHIYNLAYNYTAERQYPSKLYNTILQQDTIILLGQLENRTGFYLDNQSIAYGSGVYEIYYSSQYDTNTRAENLFNYDTSQTTTSARFGITLYSSGTGEYLGPDKINNYYGDWLIIKMPQEIMLTRYRIYQRTDAPTKAPSLWKVFGSKDGITFTEITQASQTTRLTSYTNNYYEKTLASFTTLYQYFGFVFGSLLSVSGQTDLSFAELQIFGKEIINSTITSNIYTTSNAVKGIVELEMPIVSKHYAFYITITTPIVINTKTYYKYDIDLRQYTKLGYIQIGSASGDSYRIFKLRCCFGNMYFSTLVNGIPDVLYSDIFMSMKQNPTLGLGAAGLNICSIGNINNPRLDIVPPNNLFFMRNGANSIDYITVVSTSPSDVRCFIEDMIS